MELLPLHRNTQYLETCAEILNEEWPRSKSARLHMLEKSRDTLPYSLILVNEDELEGSLLHAVIGHSRLCKVQGIGNACFIESVVIKKALRGQGFGKVLMVKTEEAASRLGFTTAYLTTHDKQDFYAHLNYEFCDPVVSLGGASSLLSEEQLQRLFGNSQDKNSPFTRSNESADVLKSKAQKDAENAVTKTLTNSDNLSHIEDLSFDDNNLGENISTVSETSSAEIPVLSDAVNLVQNSSIPAAPPPPVPKLTVSTKTVERLPQKHIYWMKKLLN